MSRPRVGEFYYHYKHDSTKGVSDHAYLVIGFSIHTESSENLIIYKPLYNSDFLNSGNADYFARPLSMWTEEILHEGVITNRFTKIEDSLVIEKLNKNVENE